MNADPRAPQPPAPYAPTPVLRRRAAGRVLGGVAGGAADHLGVDATKVRVAFALLAVLGGAGIVAYALLWVFTRTGADAAATPPAERRRAVGLIALGVAGALASGWLFSGTAASVIVPIVVVGLGAALVWREFDADAGGGAAGGPRSAIGLARRPTLLTWVRIVAGLSLVVVGLGVVVLAQVDLASLRSSLVAVVVTLIGVGLLTVPVWLRMVRSLNEERAARIRDIEREEIASHLHDSVLQTLALIQKQPDDPRQVQRLARSQERDLRRWLFGDAVAGRSGGPGASGVPDAASAGLAQALRDACAEIEDRYAVSIDPVLVGDLDAAACGVNGAEGGAAGSAGALVAAAREAMANAAEHAGVRSVDLFAEADQEGADGATTVRVYVRDRGVGFDPDAVPADRRGIAGSIRGRMDRHGGEASIRTGADRGTEVSLTMPFPRAPGPRAEG